MIGNFLLADILNKQSHSVRKQWYRDRTDKQKNIGKIDKNLEVSKLIDRLNEKIKGSNGKKTYFYNLQKKNNKS